ncbi:hypothetical protein BJY22_002883 [Kribbella shirazensis]|uniref:Uncharacterized protein n=1 Tax=Kribbella shirazensis TaxID=1105143 RepID=A0A7X5VAD9_9ACTN|nr:hypothetical protein [Kribbella shirazensis]
MKRSSGAPSGQSSRAADSVMPTAVLPAYTAIDDMYV